MSAERHEGHPTGAVVSVRLKPADADLLYRITQAKRCSTSEAVRLALRHYSEPKMVVFEPATTNPAGMAATWNLNLQPQRAFPLSRRWRPLRRLRRQLERDFGREKGA